MNDNLSSQKQDRRSFIKKTGKGIVLGSLGAVFPYAKVSNIHGVEEKKLGVALVGLGYYATHKLAVGLEETEYCEVKGIVTGTPSKIPEWKEKYNIADKNVYNYQNFENIADNPDIDIVYVVLPNAMHAEYVVKAAQAGKHVMCEKPFDINASRAATAVEACEKAGRLLQIGYRCQYDPNHKELMRIGREGDLGNIKEIRSSHSFFGVRGDNWRYTDRSLAGGGPLMDVGVYSINAARYSTGEEPTAVWARTYNTYPNLMDGMEETIVFTMEFPSGAVANMTSSYVARANFIHISAEKGNYGLEPAFGYGGASGYKGEEKIDYPKRNQQAAQMDAFARNILDGTPVVASGEEGLRDMYVIDALYKSARKNGKRIKMVGA
ncbi:MAG: Gfo/Idh/MocA family oxidoreductase [Saprospiraceae bacterium]|nr:Gfo/Idh/MocA family oxidoreductase [Saprospiraceae bacterium]